MEVGVVHMLFCFVSSYFLRHKTLYQKSVINVNKSNLTSCGARVTANNTTNTESPIIHHVFDYFLIPLEHFSFYLDLIIFDLKVSIWTEYAICSSINLFKSV